MKIERIELREIGVDLKFRFETSFGVKGDLTKLLVVLHSEGLEGYGEVTAGTVPGYNYETSRTAWVVLEDHVFPAIAGKSFSTPAQLRAALANIRGHNMTIGAVEAAFWDLLAKSYNTPLWQLLGGVRTEIPVGASLGIQESIAATVAEAEKHAAEGYRRLKFKIKPGWDVQPLRAVREALPDMALTVDANSANRITDARVFLELDELGLDYIEQPLTYDDLVDHAKLQALIGTPICLDESVLSPEDARKGLEIDAGRVINIKLGRVTGHLGARRVHDVALSFGAPVWCGGSLELGIGRAHNLHMSSLENFTLPGDTSSATRYWGDEDIIEEVLDAKAGIQHLPTTGPGLGVTLRHDLIEKFTLRKLVV